MGVTLLIGRDEDLCCRLVRDSLSAAGREYLFLPENDLFPGLNFAWEFRQGNATGLVGIGPQSIPLDRLDGVLARFSGIATSAEEHQTKDGQYLNSEWHALARGFVGSLRCPVVNRLRPELWYKMRLTVPDIVSLVPSQRFRLPRTMVTTKFREARAFFTSCGNRILYSPLSIPSDYPIESERDLERLEPLSGTLPLHLTEVVKGRRVSAFVAGADVVFEGPGDELASRRCREAASSLGLVFCEFDLVRTPEGDWYCLGIQCSPGLFNCSDETRVAVAERLTAVLCPAEGQSGRRVAA